MFDIGWAEMLVIGVVALVVVGPKDLPKMFHTVGQLMGKARGMAREFQRAMDAAAKETGVNDLARDLRKTASGQSLREATGFDEIEKQFRDIGHDPAPSRPAPTGPVAGRPAGETADSRRADSEPDESEADEAEVRAHDAALAARNKDFSETEALRLKRADEAAAARVRAAEARARREAADGPVPPEPQAWRPATPPQTPPPSAPTPSAPPSAAPSSGPSES